MGKVRVTSEFDPTADFVLCQGDCLDLLPYIPDGFVKLVVTSPPYNLGKPYESRLDMDEYLAQQSGVIRECVRVLNDRGSICWQVGNYVDDGEIIPLDILLYPIFASLGLHLRNRVVWHFGHGLHASKRFSGRYEVILWFTKSNEYILNLDAVRVPQKYPKKKYFKGPKKGQLSGNPLGKNPSDVWEIPNVKANHVEKTIHPCQFPVELIERLVLSMTDESDWVLDPFIGVGTTAIAALMHNRKAIGAEIVPEYVEVVKERIRLAEKAALRIRPMKRAVYDPTAPGKSVPPKFVHLGASLIQPRCKNSGLTGNMKSGKGGPLMSNQFNKQLRAFADDHTWVNDNLDSLLGKYAEQWIAVKNRRVIASDVDLTRLREKLAEPAHTCIEFVTHEPLEMLL